MERELWNSIGAALKRLPPRFPPGAIYTDPQILAIILWAALLDRSVSGACARANWLGHGQKRAGKGHGFPPARE